MSTNQGTCFVIMPFSKTTDKHTEDYWTKHFEDFLKPLIEENPNLKARRSKAMRGDILREIITDLVVSPVVVADLTDNNPNVYWELGVRQSFKHGTVTIADEAMELPFDIDKKGTLRYYPENHLKNADFCRDFKEAIQDCLTHPERPDSQVLETLSGRGTLFEIFHRDEAIRRLDALLSECDWNLNIWEEVVNQVQANQKKSEKRSLTTMRFRISAIELLMTNRYVDEDQSFFRLAELNSDLSIAANDILNGWGYDPENAEKWLLSAVKLRKTTVEQFKAAVVDTRDKLRKRF